MSNQSLDEAMQQTHDAADSVPDSLNLRPRSPILIVDDEISLLVSLKRRLRSRFDIVAAPDGNSALRRLETEGPFSVIISDMKMPGMSGVEFLSRTRELSPKSSRILMTGDHSLETALKAVNEGHIFQLVHKPCPSDTLADIISEGVNTYHWLTAQERFAFDWAQAIQEEFCAPLRHIIDFASFIEAGGVPSNEVRDYASYVRKRGRALMTTTHMITALSSARSQKGQLTIHPITISQLCESLQVEMSELVVEQGIDLRFYADEAERALPVDPQLFQMAVFVLAAQMINSAPQGSPISILFYTSRSQEKTSYVEILNQLPPSQVHYLDRLPPRERSAETSRYTDLAQSSLAGPLASAVIDLHGGTVNSVNPEDGLQFIRMTLPELSPDDEA